MSNPHAALKKPVLSALILFFSLLFAIQAYPQAEGDARMLQSDRIGQEAEPVRVSAVDLVRGENIIRRQGARSALRFYESLTKLPVDDERKGFVYYRMAKIYYAFGDYQRAYEAVEKSLPMLKARYNLYSAMHLRMKLFVEMGWYREAKQVAGFLTDSQFVGFDEMEMYAFMADADVRLENPVDASVEFEKAFVLGNYENRIQIYQSATEQLTSLFDRIANPFVFRRALESTNTLHFRSLISYLAAKRCLEERMFGFCRYFLTKYFDISDFTGDEERGLQIAARLNEEKGVKPIIALYLPFNGPYSDFSFMVLSGLEMVFLKDSYQRGLSEGSFFIDVYDTYGDASMLARHLEGGRVDRQVVALIGPLTGREGYFLSPRDNYPLIFYLGQKYLPRGTGLVNFGLKPAQEAMKLVNYAFSSGVFRAALLYPENGYGRAYREEVLKAAGMQGIDIVVDKPYAPEIKEFAGLIKSVVKEKNFDEYSRVEEKDVVMPVPFDGVFLLDVPERGFALHSQMVYYNIKVPYFVFASWADAAFLNEGKADLKDLYCITDFNPYSSSEKIKAFVEGFQGHFAQMPDRFAAYGYDLGEMFDSYFRRVSILGLDYSSLRDRFKREIYSQERYYGVSGKVEFTVASRAIRNLTILRADRGSVMEAAVPVY